MIKNVYHSYGINTIVTEIQNGYYQRTVKQTTTPG